MDALNRDSLPTEQEVVRAGLLASVKHTFFEGEWHFHAIGLKHLDASQAPELLEHLYRSSTTMCDGSVLARVMGFHNTRVDLVGVVDARLFSDPAGWSIHTGAKYEVFKNIITHNSFNRWARNAFAALSRLREGPSGTKHVFVYCGAGKHRSVAAALTLWTVLNYGGATSKLTFDHKPFWRQGRICGGCTECFPEGGTALQHNLFLQQCARLLFWHAVMDI